MECAPQTLLCFTIAFIRFHDIHAVDPARSLYILRQQHATIKQSTSPTQSPPCTRSSSQLTSSTPSTLAVIATAAINIFDHSINYVRLSFKINCIRSIQTLPPSYPRSHRYCRHQYFRSLNQFLRVSFIYRLSFIVKVIAMEVATILSRILHRDVTLTGIVISLSFLEACDNYASDAADAVDSVDAEENIYDLLSYVNGNRDWFEVLGSMIANLPNLNVLTFDGVDLNEEYLETFWGAVSASNSLTSINFADMSLQNNDEIFCIIDAPNVGNVVFHNCTLHREVGFALREAVHHHSLTTLRFVECRFVNTNTMREIIDFAGHLAFLPSITSLEFSSCDFDAQQSTCLLRSFREDREKSGLGPVQVTYTI